MDRIFEATPMGGYGHPLRVSVFVDVVEYVDDDVVEPNALPQSISSSASADRSGCCCCCKYGHVNVYCNVVDDDAPRPLAGDCTRTSWCALVLCETCGCVLL